MAALTPEFIEEHYRKNFDRLVKLFTRRAGTEWDAEDVVQQAYLRLILFSRTYDPNQSFDAWFNRILINTSKEHYNKNRTGESFDEDDFDGTPDLSYDKELWNQILRELEGVSDNGHKDLLRLYFVQGMKPRDLVKITCYKYKNVVTIIDRFKRMVKEKYG